MLTLDYIPLNPIEIQAPWILVCVLTLDCIPLNPAEVQTPWTLAFVPILHCSPMSPILAIEILAPYRYADLTAAPWTHTTVQTLAGNFLAP